MQKGEADVKRKQIVMRMDVDPEAFEAIGEIADRQGRNKGRQLGIIIENVFRLYSGDPAKLQELGLLEPPPLAAVA